MWYEKKTDVVCNAADVKPESIQLPSPEQVDLLELHARFMTE